MMFPWTRKRLERERAEAIAKHNEMTWFCPGAAAMGDHLKIDKIYPTDVQGNPRIIGHTGTARSYEGFESTKASQWSTADYSAPKKLDLAKLSPLKIIVEKNHHDIHLVWRPGVAKEQLAHWKWLAENPRLAWRVVQQSRARKQSLLDSALFV